MTRIAQSNDPAAQWRGARQIYPVYAELMRQFGLGLEPCRDLENPADHFEPEVLERVGTWFDEMDQSVQVHELRQFLHSSALATEQNLQWLIERHLGKPAHTDSDRDKVDFLLVQYYAHCVSPELNERESVFAGVAEVLKPVLGEVSGPAPDELRPLELALQVLGWCRSLGDMLENGALAHGRRIKSSIGEKYFESAALVEFVRFNFFLRRAFFRLLQSDLHAIRRALDELEKKGHSIVDCSPAGLAPEASLAALRQKCMDWKKPFLASYSSGRLPFEEIVAVRRAVELALTQPPLQPKPAVVEAVAAPRPAPQPVSAAPAVPAPAIELPDTMPQALETPAMPPAAAMQASKTKPQPRAEKPVVAQPVAVPPPVAAAPAAPPVAKPVAAKPLAPPKPAAASKPAAAAASPAAVPAPAHKAKAAATHGHAPSKPAPTHKAKAVATHGHAPSKPAAPQPADVQSCLEAIAEQLFAFAGKATSSAANVIVGETRVVLSSWEVEAFVRGGDEVNDALQRVVSARALLFGAVESRRRGGDSEGLPAIISLAQTEAAQAQQQIAGAKKARNLDGAVNLAATTKRLLALIAEAEGLVAVPSAAETTH